MADCYVGLDLGTSGCRAIAIDRDGAVLAEARTPLPSSSHPGPGASEQRPQDWWQAVQLTLRELVARCPAQVRALSVDGTSSTLLLSDMQGAPLTAALMYDDTRAGLQAAQIARLAPPDSPARGAGSALAKMLYLLDQGHAGSAAYASHQADWILGRLGGKFGVTDENNALKLGYDPVARRWPPWLAGLAFPQRLLPRVCPVGTPLDVLSADVAADLGLPGDARLVAGTTDSNAAALAAGVDGVGDAVTSLGSTLVLKVFSDHPVWSARYGVYSHRIGERWLVGGASNAGGCVLRRYFDDAELADLSRRIDPERNGDLGYYPLPAPGERFPHHDPQMMPRLDPRPDDRAAFLHALLEGLAAIEVEGYRRLDELGAPYPRCVFSSGGGAVNDAWRRIRERRLGVPVRRAPHTEAAYGAALLARAAMTGRPTASG